MVHQWGACLDPQRSSPPGVRGAAARHQALSTLLTIYSVMVFSRLENAVEERPGSSLKGVITGVILEPHFRTNPMSGGSWALELLHSHVSVCSGPLCAYVNFGRVRAVNGATPQD